MKTDQLERMDPFSFQNNLELLEMDVEKRIMEFQKIRKALQEKEAENRKLKDALRISENERHHLTSELITAQEGERKRLAFELHDVLGKSLTAIKFCVENTLLTKKRWDKQTKENLENVISMVQATIKETREITTALWPPVLDDLGILATISWYSREFETMYPWMFINRNICLKEIQIPHLIKLVIFRILQEAMNNCVKHSQCRNINITLGNESSAIGFSVEDDGLGFDLNTIKGNPDERQRFGLLSMKERARLSGGIFEIRSSQGSGTLVKVLWPMGN